MHPSLDLLLEPLQWAFMQRGLLAAILVGLSCSVLGTFVVLRGLSFIGDAVSHAALPGIVVALMMKANLFAGAFFSGILTALGIGWVARKTRLKEDTAIGIIFTGMFALGLILMSRLKGTQQDITHILFGNILGISHTDLIVTGAVTLLVLSVVTLLFKELVLTSFDETHASAMGVPSTLIHNILLILLALAIVSGIQTVGVILVASLLVTPPAAAYLLCKQLRGMILLSLLMGTLSGIIGLYVSYYAAVPSGPAIVLTATLFFLFALLWKRLKPSTGR